MPTKKKAVAKKKAALVKKKPVAKKKSTDKEKPVRMMFIKENKKGKVEIEGELIRKLLYKGTEYFLIKLDDGVKKYMNARFWVGEA